MKAFIDNGLFEADIIEHYSHKYGGIFDLEIPVSSPTILLELCHEAQSISMAEFDKAFKLCTSTCYVQTMNQSRFYRPTSVYVRRLLSLALDNHITKFYPDLDRFSVYKYHLQKGYFMDLSQAVKGKFKGKLQLRS